MLTVRRLTRHRVRMSKRINFSLFSHKNVFILLFYSFSKIAPGIPKICVILLPLQMELYASGNCFDHSE
jgi:hypothetical protein